ncbi:MAG TPA: cation diffusion facilitator family transporter [Vicinamibacterales bacterium]|nr:cation diffusion facilitator family transporter [Vicinamibacterales bacterium]
MGPGHSHPHTGHGQTTRRANARALKGVLVLVAAYMVAEVIGGLITNSLALLADAGHMLSDVAALSLALFALWFAARPAPPHRTYGYYRAEILAALANGAALVVVAVFILIEAYNRLWDPPEVRGGLMMIIATGGLVVNLVSLRLLHAGRDDSLNLRGAWLHVVTDLLGSVQAVAAGGLILLFGWTWADPLASVLIGALVFYSAWSLVSASVSVLMESAPGSVDVDAVWNALREVPGVSEVHDLHIWSITSGMPALSVHLVAGPDADQRWDELLGRSRDLLRDRFGVAHTTIQVEGPCGCQPCGAQHHETGRRRPWQGAGKGAL